MRPAPSSRRALARGAKIYGDICGSAINSDARDFVLPYGPRQRECMELALERAGMQPCDITIINTHATGTKQGDIEECRAIRETFAGCSNTWINNTKSHIGHAMGAAGVLELAGNLPAFSDHLVEHKTQTPLSPNDTPVTPPLTSPCCESEQLPGEPLAINMAMHRTIGCVNDLLWGTPWLGQEYARRANRHGFRSYLIDTPDLTATPQPNLGSRERFQQRFEAASAYIRSQWGQQQHLALYLTAGIDSACIQETTQTLLQAAREGLTVSLILHPRDLRRPEIATLTHCHHGITTTVLPRLMATRAIKRHIQHLRVRPVPTILGVIGPLTAVPASCGEWLPADQALDLARNQRSTHEHVHSQSA